MMKALSACALAATLFAVTGCQNAPSEGPARYSILGSGAPFITSNRLENGSSASLVDTQGRGPAGYTDLGSDTTVSPRQSPAEAVLVSDNGAKVSLNFVNVETQEFVRVVFDEILKESVVVDPGLTGRITVRTTEPVSRSTALSLVRNVLQLNNASLAKSGGIFRVSGRVAGGQARGQIGENIRIVPVRYLNPEQARAALQPFSSQGTDITANGDGRYLVLSGSPADLDSLSQVLETLDVDHMQGMSFALVPLKDANAISVSGELMQMFGQGGGSGFRAMPIQRMNAVLLMTRNRESLTRAKTWIEQLDQSGSDSRQVRVFPIQNRRAADLAQILNGILLGAGNSTPEKPDNAVTAPSLTPATSQTAGIQPASAFDRFQPTSPGAPNSIEAASGSSNILQGAQIRADVSTNSLVVMARPEAYKLIEATIRRLDVLPTQVLIEATIAEVGLNDALRHGVRWYFQSGPHGVALTDDQGRVAPLAGFNYVFSAPQGRVVVDALEKVTDVEVISSPALTVLDNETANLKVGDQVPVATRSARSVTNPEAPVVNDIELKDTGIILSVTPRVNSSGMVMLDISQEVSDVVQTSTSNIDSPTIRQRKINSSVAVQSGQEIVLGGLISSANQTGKDGVPVLKDIPILGAAFTSKGGYERKRTELLIIIRPTVMANRLDVQRVTEEIKANMTRATAVLTESLGLCGVAAS
ncbi:type II secretion system protein GspD [Microvirga sp. KLBC 81]|uniref:type II secretion system secretin GspD n=1 Tax=Microvirga sp. KLBC 81 TaxID=1862707 RepID=UPI000D520718|nr:type II secretion system secretin GspD [Microvirga sp. KLBC 81]PVE25951.1 type II secretion system protein GspD [Microvirga sp. KLBC 81]